MNWRWHLLLAALVAAAVHAVAVWALPHAIMARVLQLAGADADPRSGIYLAPPIDHTQRRIVMPSPDLLYASCVWDLARGPVRVQASPQLKSYWSLALYASNSDNVFVFSDRESADGAVDLLLVAEGERSPAAAPGQRVVSVPSRRGLLLMRLLLDGTPEQMRQAEQARQTLRCGVR